MQTSRSLEQSKPNIDPQRIHHRQRFWQIIFPVLIVSVALVAGIVYLLLPAGAPAGDVAGLAQTATVILVLPLLFMLLPLLAITIAVIVLLGRIAGWLPNVSENVFAFSERMRHAIQKGTSSAVAPLFFIKQRNAELQQLIRSIHPKSKGQGGL